jgi:hypothetical protein
VIGIASKTAGKSPATSACARAKTVPAHASNTATSPGGRKKQLVVALARGFGVDWWRLRTGQTTPEKLGLIMNADAQPSATQPKD